MKKPGITDGKWQWMKFLNDDGTIEEITIDNGDEHNMHLLAEIFWSKNSEYKETHLAVLKEAKANAQAISAVPNAVDDYKSLLHAIENNKTDRGAVILGDKLEKSIKATAKKMGFKE